MPRDKEGDKNEVVDAYFVPIKPWMSVWYFTVVRQGIVYVTHKNGKRFYSEMTILLSDDYYKRVEKEELPFYL